MDIATFLKWPRYPYFYFDDHKEPFDRLLSAQSLSEPLIFLTADIKLACATATAEAAFG